MSEKRLRISIIVLLMAVAVASFGCGGGSGANSVTGGDFITAVVPDSGLSSGSESSSSRDESSSSGSESENANLGDPPSNGDGDRGSGSTTVSTPAGGGNTPAVLRQNVQTKQQIDYSKIREGHIALPPGHGLDPGQIRMLYGFSEQRGNIIASCPRDKFGWCTIDVGEDGFATYNGIIDKSVHERVPSLEPEIIPLPQPDEAAQAARYRLREHPARGVQRRAWGRRIDQWSRPQRSIRFIRRGSRRNRGGKGPRIYGTACCQA